MSDINWTPVIIVGLIALVLGGFFGGMLFPKEIAKDCPELNVTADCPELNVTADCPECETCPECKTSEEIEEELILTGGYIIDGFFLEEEKNWNKYGKLNLFDGEIEFDGDDYDAEERFILTGLTLKTDITDFEGNDYLTMPSAGAFEYTFKLKSNLDISSITDQKTLQIKFLGKDVEISEWKTNEITFTQGEEYSLSKGESVVVEGKNITLEFVLEGAAYVTIEGIDSKSGKIKEGEGTMKFEGIEIKAKEVLFSGYAGGYEQATLIIGTNIETTVITEEEYEEDSIWEWIINEDFIGLTLREEFTELDDDDNFNVLAPGKTICLPNDYICVLYNGLYKEVEEKYELEFDNTNDFVKIRSKEDSKLFIDDEEEDKFYIKRDTGIIYTDRDNVSTEVDPTQIKFGYADFSLIINETGIIINDLAINLDLDWTNFGCADVDYRTNYGIFIEDLKTSCEKKEFTITIPEEQLEGKITIKQGRFGEEPVCDVDNLELCLDETTCTDAEGYWYSDVCNVEEASSE